MKPEYGKVAEGFRLVLEGLGCDPKRPHFAETATRAARAWYNELCRTLTEPDLPRRYTTTFPSAHTGMVISRGIPIRSVCAHHLLPFVGTATIGYIPHDAILGLSKLSRLADYVARQPQVQEELTDAIADLLEQVLFSGQLPLDCGIGVIVQSRHFCMEMRGVEHVSDVTTSAVRGVFLEPAVRDEFLSLARR